MEAKNSKRNDMVEVRLSTDRKEQVVDSSPPFGAKKRRAHSVELDQPPSGSDDQASALSYGDEESDGEYDGEEYYDSEANDTVQDPHSQLQHQQQRKGMQSIPNQS